MSKLSFRRGQDDARRDSLLFGLCLALSLLALILPEGARDPFAAGLRRSVLLPALKLQEATEGWRSVALAHGDIVAERDSAVREAQFVVQLRAENERLRTLIGLAPRIATAFVAAEVLHQAQATDGMTLLLSAGRSEGVRPLAPVITERGLVGIVTDVDATTSVAMTWAHPRFGASAMTEDGTIFGIVEPTRGNRLGVDLLELRGVAYGDSIPAGTWVVTSGLSGVLPKGTPLGTVLGISREAAGWERAYYVLPAVHPSDVSHVLILIVAGRDTTDVSGAFEGGSRAP